MLLPPSCRRISGIALNSEMGHIFLYVILDSDQMFIANICFHLMEKKKQKNVEC